jgi:hypothetical protein
MKCRIAGISLLLLLAACSPNETPKESMPAAAAPMEEEMTSETTTDTEVSFIPADFEPPVLVEAEGFKLVPLGPELVKIDFDAYMSSIEHLQTTFTRNTNWPREGITDEEAMLDMETEQARFQNRESFAYGVLTPDGARELGSFYVRPSAIEGYDAVVRMWVTKADFDAGFDEELYAWGQDWIAKEWPFKNVAYPGRAIEWAAWDEMVAAANEKLMAQNAQTAEGFIDAFYSFDPKKLEPYFVHADETQARIARYQGWAEGGNYIVMERGACVAASPTLVECPITVQDDPVQALKTGFNVTDTFHITFDGTNIASFKTSSNDQPIYYEARKWVEANMPEVMEGPCLDSNMTPGDCARAMTKGYAAFYAATREGKEQPES